MSLARTSTQARTPEGPTRATTWPALTDRLRFWRTGLSGRASYRNVTFCNLMSPLKLNSARDWDVRMVRRWHFWYQATTDWDLRDFIDQLENALSGSHRLNINAKQRFSSVTPEQSLPRELKEWRYWRRHSMCKEGSWEGCQASLTFGGPAHHRNKQHPRSHPEQRFPTLAWERKRKKAHTAPTKTP